LREAHRNDPSQEECGVFGRRCKPTIGLDPSCEPDGSATTRFVTRNWLMTRGANVHGGLFGSDYTGSCLHGKRKRLVFVLNILGEERERGREERETMFHGKRCDKERTQMFVEGK